MHGQRDLSFFSTKPNPTPRGKKDVPKHLTEVVVSGGAGREHGVAELPLGVSADLRKRVTVQSPTHHLALYPVDLGVVVVQAGVTQVHRGPGSWDHQEGEWLRVVPQSHKHDRNCLVSDMAMFENHYGAVSVAEE